MRSVFIQGGPVPPHLLLAKVQRARLKVELCEECVSLSENISKQCRQLEKLKMEIEAGLESIHGKMSNADNAGRAEHFQKVVGSDGDSGMGGLMDILEALRQETVQKCSGSLKISKVSPRLEVQRLADDEIQRKTFRMYEIEAETKSERMFNSGWHHERAEIEQLDSIDWALEDGNHSENSFVDHLDDGLDGSSPTVLENLTEHAVGPVTMEECSGTMQTSETAAGSNLQRKFVLNPETKKYGCQLCSMEFASKSGLGNHHNAVHRKLRFKCKICGKEFKQKCYFKIHHRNAHLGIRFQCQVCQKIFTLKTDVRTHQTNARCVNETS